MMSKRIKLSSEIDVGEDIETYDVVSRFFYEFFNFSYEN